MTLEIILVLLYILFCIKASAKTIVYSIFLLLPLHGFIKMAIFTDSGAIFTMWKEFGIIIALLKTRKIRCYRPRIFNITVFIYLLIIFLFLFIGINNRYSINADIRKFIFPVPLLYLVSKIKFNMHDLKKIIFCILMGSALINITGVIDFLSPTIRLVMRTIMGIEFKIASNGTIYYEISSYKIMGMDRVCGFMGGGPNMMGVFNASVFLLSIYAYIRGIFISKKGKLFFTVTFMLCVFNLLLSFSRAGWALVGITFFYIAATIQKYRKIAFIALWCIFVIGIISYLSLEIVQKVVDGTLSGNEASSAERGNMTRSALNYLFDNPLGYGLGASTRDNGNYVYFAESSLINFGISTGILGIILYSCLIYIIFKIIKYNKSNPLMLIAPGFVVAYYITAWVSVNMVENPFVYYAWLIMGLSMNKNLSESSLSIPLYKNNCKNNIES